MPHLSVDVSRDESGTEVVCAKFSDEQWELNVWATRSEFMGLGGIRALDWNSRRVAAVGHCAGARAFWSSDGRTATVMIGQDDETWDMAVTMPVEIVDELVTQLGV